MNRPGSDSAIQELLSKLPAVDQLLSQPAVVSLLDDYPRGEVVRVVRSVLDARRTALREGRAAAIDLPALALEIRQHLYERAHPSLRKAINATGVVLHTNLGRAPLAEQAVEAIAEVAGGYCNLELDLATGRRGLRHDHVRELLRELCGVEDALVVNNNAAATFLALNALAAEREVIVSRGQLIEIGGSYRLPDIMSAARCRMVEVGTTNRTRIADYERALSEHTSVLLRVHTSNYRIHGFTESATLAELVELGRRHGLVVVDDLGSGLLSKDLPWPEPEPGEDAQAGVADELPTDPRSWEEPSVAESVAAGADLSLFSGDKLLGGPQAGVIVGRADLIASLRKNPLARTFRPGKLTLAGLEATLRLYRDPSTLTARLPAYRMLARTPQELQAAAERLAQQIVDTVEGAEARTAPDYSETGGGSLAAIPFPTWVVSARLADLPPERVASALRRRDLPIICRVHDGALVFDLRTLDEGDAGQVAAALAEARRELS
jgi:L-seryl-tRNA(Ser) seleniumtransferase